MSAQTTRAWSLHELSAVDADPCAVTARTPSSHFVVVSATHSVARQRSCGPCGQPQHRLGALATKVRAISRLARRGGPFAVLAFATIVFVTLALSVPVSAKAEDLDSSRGTSDAPTTASHLESLLETLRDDAEREELLRAIESLVEAQRVRTADAPPPEAGGIGDTALAFLSRRVEAFGRVAADATRLIAISRRLAGDSLPRPPIRRRGQAGSNSWSSSSSSSGRDFSSNGS